MKREKKFGQISLDEEILDFLSHEPRKSEELFKSLGLKSSNKAPMGIPDSQLSAEGLRRKMVIERLTLLKTSGQIIEGVGEKGKRFYALPGQVAQAYTRIDILNEKAYLDDSSAYLDGELLKRHKRHQKR